MAISILDLAITSVAELLCPLAGAIANAGLLRGAADCRGDHVRGRGYEGCSQEENRAWQRAPLVLVWVKAICVVVGI